MKYGPNSDVATSGRMLLRAFHTLCVAKPKFNWQMEHTVYDCWKRVNTDEKKIKDELKKQEQLQTTYIRLLNNGYFYQNGRMRKEEEERDDTERGRTRELRRRQ